MEGLDNALPNGSDVEIADVSVQGKPQSPPLENPSQVADEKAKPSESTPPGDEVAMAEEERESKENGGDEVAMAEDERESKENGGDLVEEPVQEKDASVEESNGNGCNNQDVTASPPSPEKVSTPVPSGSNVEAVKNGFEDIEMGEAEEESELLGDGTLVQQAAFMKELETFHKEKALDFKPPKFYGELLNCLKLWRAVVRLGGYDVVTTSKLWRQVGESFHPPKTCTTVSWTFRIFYEKALLEYEKHKRQIGELQVGSFPQPINVEKEASSYQTQGSGRARRDAAARAMQGWHAQRLLGFGEVTEPIVKDKNTTSASKREKNIKSIGSLKHKMNTTTQLDQAERTPTMAVDKQLSVVTSIIDVGPPADWVKINVRETKDCFEVYALVPGLLREEVRVQSDPAGRLVITGQPEQVDNPWGITPFQKVVTLPSRIDPLHTSAVVSLHGRLFVRVPFEQGSV